jgi:hypothetical protein
MGQLQFSRTPSNCARGLLILAAAVCLTGCQNAAWKNPYAAFGPLTIPAPSQAQVPEGGYYQPPPATGTLTAAATPSPTGAAPTTTSTGPSISAVDLARMPATGPSNEPPIQIVEPGSAVPVSGRSSPTTPPTSTPIREPRAAPARTPWGSVTPAANPTSSVAIRPETTVPTIRRDSMVTPATYQQPAFREATIMPTDGAWQAR